MRFKTVLLVLLTLGIVLASGCGSQANCPVCGTTKNDGYALINVIPVPEHNPTGTPGGPFVSFDISVVDPVNHKLYTSDRIGLDVVVVDTINNVAINTIGGANEVAQGGNNASGCVPTIPPITSALSTALNPIFTRFGCRTGSTVPQFSVPGLGPNGLFGGFTGAQCCAARANGVNPLSCPCGIVVTADGKTMFVGNASSNVVVFDLTAKPVPTVIATIPTGQSPDFDGPVGVAPCVASSQGRALTDPTCGDMRSDEMAYDEKDKILFVTNGDPGIPFATLIDMSAVVARTGNCLPVDPTKPYGPTNFPTCILGQIYYDGVAPLNNGVAVDSGSAPCPDPSSTAPSGVSGTGVGAGGKDVPCHHGPVINPAGVFCNQAAPAANCAGAVSLAGLGGSAFNPNTGHFLVTNGNANGDLTIGTVDEIDPRIGNPAGPIVVNTFPVSNCMPTSVVQGPGNQFLVGCANHDGVTFPPSEIIIDGTKGTVLATIDKVGGVDEVWFNPGDQRYYLAARDMPTGPVMGVIDAKTNTWLQNVTTGPNSHSIAVDPSNNHAFVPLQAGPLCTTQSANGCIGVYAQQ